MSTYTSELIILDKMPLEWRPVASYPHFALASHNKSAIQAVNNVASSSEVDQSKAQRANISLYFVLFMHLWNNTKSLSFRKLSSKNLIAMDAPAGEVITSN